MFFWFSSAVRLSWCISSAAAVPAVIGIENASVTLCSACIFRPFAKRAA